MFVKVQRSDLIEQLAGRRRHPKPTANKVILTRRVFLVLAVRPGGIVDIATRMQWEVLAFNPLAFEANRREKWVQVLPILTTTPFPSS